MTKSKTTSSAIMSKKCSPSTSPARPRSMPRTNGTRARKSSISSITGQVCLTRWVRAICDSAGASANGDPFMVGSPYSRSSEPVFVQIGGGSVACVEQVELRGRLGEFVVEEVPRGEALAVIEIPRLAVRGQSLLQPDPGQHDMADGFEVHGGIRQRAAGLTVLPERQGGELDPLRRRCQRVRPAGQRISQRRCLAARVPDSLEQHAQAAAAVDEHLAAEKIEGLNAVCALVNGVEPIVPVELFDVVITGIAVSAVDLDSQAVGLNAPLRWPAFGDRGQHLKQKPGIVAVGIGWGGKCFVDKAAAVQTERQGALDVALLG